MYVSMDAHLEPELHPFATRTRPTTLTRAPSPTPQPPLPSPHATRKQGPQPAHHRDVALLPVACLARTVRIVDRQRFSP